VRKFGGFKFTDTDIALLSSLNHTDTIEKYQFYKNKNLYLYDLENNKLLKVKTYKKSTRANFYNNLLTAYKFAYNIKWSGSILNKQKLNVEDAKFIFEQSEKYLKDSIETSSTIVVRVNTVITIIVAVVIGLSSYIVNKWENQSTGFNNILITSSIGLLYFYVLGFFAVRNVYPSPYFPIGSLPKDLFSDDFFLNEVPNEDRIIRYYVSEIENYQFRIERNNYKNGDRWALYKRTLWLLLTAPIVFFLTYGLLIIFRS